MAVGNFRSAMLTTQKLCKSVGVGWAWAECNELEPMENQVWLSLFAKALMNYTMTGTM